MICLWIGREKRSACQGEVGHNETAHGLGWPCCVQHVDWKRKTRFTPCWVVNKEGRGLKAYRGKKDQRLTNTWKLQPFSDSTSLSKHQKSHKTMSSTNAPRMVPWTGWNEWDAVRQFLYSTDKEERKLGVKRVCTHFKPWIRSNSLKDPSRIESSPLMGCTVQGPTSPILWSLLLVPIQSRTLQPVHDREPELPSFAGGWI